jgi:preprotein translocase subunit Sec63
MSSSSGFKENFERGEKESLDYDDSAFYYFGLALLTVSAFPMTWYLILQPIFYGETTINNRLNNCQCYLCKDRMAKRAKKYRFSWLNTWFLIKLLIVCLVWYACYFCFQTVKDVEPLKTFVPNELLGVEMDATVA